jgi:FixJ family two-component response regulator
VTIIIVTGHGSEEVAVNAMKAGAFDYLTKPVVLGKLKILLDKAGNRNVSKTSLPITGSAPRAGAISTATDGSQPCLANEDLTPP